MHDHGTARSPYFVARCANGCFHLVWNNITIHLSEDDFEMLVSIVGSAYDRVLQERGANAEREQICVDSPIM